jgi:subtilisin family serine protease
LRTSHRDFKDRVIAGKNFTDEGAGEDDVSDLDGHGTNVAGIVVAGGSDTGGIHLGMAPKAKIVPLKVLTQAGGDFGAVSKALKWVLDHRAEHNISVVNMSLGDSGNYQDDQGFAGDAAQVQTLIKALRAQRVAVVVAAGNAYHTFSPKGSPAKEGMGFPAAVRETVSVGAVFDRSDSNAIEFVDGTIVFSQKPNGIAAFSQRLHQTVSPTSRTDIFAPGAPIVSSGNASDDGSSVESGTSQASPVAAGVILLVQEAYKAKHGDLPTVDQVEGFLRLNAVKLLDGALEDDNVAHTGKEFLRLDALEALDAARPDVLGAQQTLIRNELIKANVLKSATR